MNFVQCRRVKFQVQALYFSFRTCWGFWHNFFGKINFSAMNYLMYINSIMFFSNYNTNYNTIYKIIDILTMKAQGHDGFDQKKKLSWI